DDVSISTLTVLGPHGTVTGVNNEHGGGGEYGIKVEPDSADRADLVHNFSLTNVTVSGSGRSQIDLNGVSRAPITNVLADGHIPPGDAGTQGAGIALTDSIDVSLANISTTGNQWGSVALYPTNTYYDQQLTGITFTGTYSHDEPIGIFNDDASATTD